LCSFWNNSGRDDLHSAMSKAEKLVGHPTTFSSLKYLFDGESSNFISLAKKLVGSGHPLLSTARGLLSQDPLNSHQLGGVWVLLIAKAAGPGLCADLNDPLVNGISKKQRILVEAMELIKTAFLIHRSMLNLAHEQYLQHVNHKTLNFGNKLSILGGDYLLAKASLELSKLQNTEVVEFVSQAIGDMSEGAMLEELCADMKTWNLADWENYVYLSDGSLISNTCKSAVRLLNHSSEIQSGVAEFGRHIAFSLAISKDLENFKNSAVKLQPFNFITWLALQKCEQVERTYSEYLEKIDDLACSERLRREILLYAPNIMDEVSSLSGAYVDKCKQLLHVLRDTDTKDTVYTILNNMISK